MSGIVAAAADESSRASRQRRPAPPSIARLPLYDLPELRDANQALWTAIRLRLEARGVEGQVELARGQATPWKRLLLGQTCGYRYATEAADRVKLVATPRYRARAADGPFVRAAVVVRASDPASGLADLHGRSCAFDERDLNSLNLLRAEAAPLARGGAFFGRLRSAGSFLASAEQVVAAEADAALMDGVAYAQLERLRPALTRGLRVLIWTSRSPGPPFVTARSTPPHAFEALTEVIAEVAQDAALREVLGELMIAGFNTLSKSHYRAATYLEQIAQAQGYPQLR